MKTVGGTPKKKRSIKKIILWIVGIILVIILGTAVFLYYNFNRLLTSALNKSFNASLISDVYELKFNKLSVNLLNGNISVHDVTLQPRQKPLRDYPYINSSFKLKADKILLGDVQISTLLKSNVLKLEQIELAGPGIDFTISDVHPVFFPFRDTVVGTEKQSGKKPIESFSLHEFKMTDASFHVANSAKRRNFNIQQINLLVRGLLINQEPGKDNFRYNHAEFSIGKLTGDMQRESLKHVSFKDYSLTVDSLEVQRSVDTATFRFMNFTTSIRDLDIHTEDSIFHLFMKSFDLSYRERSIKLRELSFKPNISETAIQAMFPYSHTQYSGSMGSIEFAGLNFDSLIHSRKLLMDQVIVDKVSVAIFKDNTKPSDKTKLPKYLGQSIKGIKMPLSIKKARLTNVNLVNREKKPDGSYGIANIRRGTVEVKNITNLSPGELVMKADAYLENKAHFNATLVFSYQEPRFNFDIAIQPFPLTDINQLIQSYTPAHFNKGVLDGMEFSGNADESSSTGTMKFLYHDLDLDLELKEKAGWKSAVLTFGANTILPSANPSSPDIPARVVQFHVDGIRKSFVGVVIKSLLTGLKETMIMSKENKKAYKEEKKLAKQQRKEEKKKAKEERKAEKKRAKEAAKNKDN